MKKTKALFIGRFQPLHKGHLHAIKFILSKFDEVIIVIGSTNKKNTFENPFSFKERKYMLQESGLKFEIIGINDIINDIEWVNSIVKKIKFDVVVTGNEWTKRCFSFQRYKVIELNLLEPEKYNSTNIRKKILNDDDTWKELVPQGTLKVLEKINIKERLR